MCKYCVNKDGELGTPLIHSSRKLGPISVELDVWVWNKYGHGGLWYTVDLAGETIMEFNQKIKYCPRCGRDLEVM